MSIGVTIAAIVIYIWPTDKNPWSKYIDPACTLIFSIAVLSSCKKTLWNCFFILMEGAPSSIDGHALRDELAELGESCTEFHIWSLSRGKNAMSAQIKCRGNPMQVLKKAKKVVKDYGIDLSTI